MNITNSIPIICIIVATALHRICSKNYTLRIRDGAFTFSVLNIGSAILIYLLSGGFHFGFPPSLYLFALTFSLFYFAAAFFYLMAIETGSLAITSLIISYATVVPALFGLIFLHEPASATLLIGLLFLAVSLFLINGAKRASCQRFSFKWLLFVSLTFIGNAGTAITPKLQQLTFSGLYKNEFLVLSFSIATVACLLIALFKEKKSITKNLRRGGIYGICCGLFSGIINLSIALLSDPARNIPASVMFPLISAGSIICSFLVALYVFKEKLSRQQFVGFCLGIVAIALLSI